MQIIFTPGEILAIVQPRQVRGGTMAKITGIAALTAAQPGDLSFLGNAKYKAEVAGTRASVVLLPADHAGEPQADQLFVLVDNPSVALAQVCARIEQSLWPRPVPGIHPSAVVARGARIAASATVGPLCIVEADASVGERVHLQAQVFVGRAACIGDDCWFSPGAILQAECVTGNRVRVHPGAIIGSDGFGYEFRDGRQEKLPQIGTVVLEDDVEIGANTTIDRARFSRTVIGTGTKIDNLVQIGHNVTIGRHCVLCAQVGISGSVVIGDYVVLAGQVGVVGHITIGQGVKAGGQAGISADVEPGKVINGTPAIPFQLERRLVVLQHRLPELFRRVDALEQQLKKSSS